MNWLNPAAALWLLLVPALVVLYMLRPRSLRKPVSSLRLWQALPQVDKPRARLRRPPLSLLLLMQILLLLAGAFALMQPALTAPAGRHLTIILDASGSMQATDGSSTRFEEARSEASRLASNMRPQDHATLLRVGANVTTACSGCVRADLEHALAEARVGSGQADLKAALAVAAGLAGLAGQAGDDVIDTYVVSDGAFSELPVDVLPTPLKFIQVGSAINNVAITALDARRPPNGAPGYTAFARVDNLGDGEAFIEVSALADTVPMQTRQVQLPAGGHADLVWQVPAGAAKVTVSISPHDSLVADDRAVLFLPSEGKYKVLINSVDPSLYMRALDGLPGLEPITSTEGTASEAVFSIIEGPISSTLPAGSLLLVNSSGSLITLKGDLENATAVAVADHPLLNGVDLRALLVQKGKVIEASWLGPVVQSETGPLLLAGERDGRRVAVLAFDPRDSNLPKLAAFPLLMANLVEWLYPLAGAEALRPGEPAYLAPDSKVTTPDGRAVTVGQTGVFADTDGQGIYKVAAPGKSESVGTFAVNMASGQESGAAPRPHPELQRVSQQVTSSRLDKQEYWASLAALALFLVGAEWLFYCWKRGSM